MQFLIIVFINKYMIGFRFFIMLLIELFDRTPFSPEVKKIEDIIRRREFAPDDKVKQDGDVLDLELPTKKSSGGDAHFFQRVRERGITGNEIARALMIGAKRISPSDREYYSSDEGAEGEQVEFFDPATKTFIPAMVTANDDCIDHPEDSSTCSTPSGKAPKHTIVAKTIYKKDRQ